MQAAWVVTVRTVTARFADRDITASDVLGREIPQLSADLSILRAWCRAEEAAPAWPCLRPEPAPDLPPKFEQRCGACAPCRRYQATIVAAVETAVQQASLAAPSRVLGKHYHRVPPAIRPLLGRRGRDQSGLKELLGHFVKWERWEQQALAAALLLGRKTNAETGWIEGLAALTERETQAYWLHIRGWTRTMIARELTDPEKRHDRPQWISFKTVSNLCWQAKVKVLTIFGLAALGSPDDDWPDED